MPGIKWHELDESHLHIVLTRERSEVGDFIFVVTTHNHCVDLYRFEVGRLRSGDSRQHLVQHINASHPLENVTFQTIKTNRHAVQSGVFQTLRALRQVVTIRREREILKPARLQPSKLANDRLDIATQHRLAAGQTDLLNTQTHENVAHVLNLFVREHLFFGRDRRLTVRQAVKTTEITAIGQRHAQIANRPIVRVAQQHPGNHTV